MEGWIMKNGYLVLRNTKIKNLIFTFLFLEFFRANLTKYLENIKSINYFTVLLS